jgi:hypothetical protein
VATAAMALVDRDMVTRVWDEMDYRIDVCFHRITKGGHIEHREIFKKKMVRLSVFQCSLIWYPLRSLFTANFFKRFTNL